MSPALTDPDNGVAAPPVSPSASARLPAPAAAVPPRARWRRAARLGLGLSCLGFAALTLMPSPFTLDSGQAVVNAPLLTLRSPIAGTVHFAPADSAGSRSGEPGEIQVDAHLADDSRLDQLRVELAGLRGRVELQRQQLGTMEALSAELAASARKYREVAIRRLELQREAAKSSVAQTEAVRGQRDYEQKVSERLVASGSVSGLEFVSNRFT